MADRSILVRLRADVSDFQSKMKQAAGSTNDFIGKHEQSFNQLGGVGMKAGAVLVGAFGLAVAASANFEQAMSNVAATGEDARSNMDGLREAAIQFGASTAFSATEAAEGIENLLKAGVSAKDVLGGGLAGALDLAAAGGLSVADAAEIASTAMVQFKLSGEDVPHIADLLAAGAGKAAGEVSDMAAALKQSGLVASATGLTIEETTGTLAAFASAGLIGSDAGTSFKTMLQKLANPSKEAAKEMSSLGISAYDANGNFVGMSALAGQLESSLKNLTPAQRDAAMATIFGSDAVRAANVLYQQGAAGIAEWIAQVNDQGYAAETAATKMDNLKGDLEQLGGSVETAMIRMGSSAQGPLRGLVQGVSGAVDAFGQLHPAAQGAIGVAVGSAGAFLLVAGGAMKAATSVSSTISAYRDIKQSWSDLVPAGSKTEGALKGVGAAAGVAAGALAAIAVGKLISDLTKVTVTAGDAEVMLLDFAGGAGTLKGAFHDSGVGISSLDDALSTLGRNDWWSGLQAGVQGLTGIRGNVTAAQQSIATLDQALTQMKTKDAAEAFDQIRNSQEGAKLSTEQLAAIFPLYSAKLQAAAKSSGQTVTAGDALTASLLGTASAADTAAEELKGAVESTNAYGSAALKNSGSAMALEAAIDGATESVKKNKQNLDIGTEAGRNNRAALDAIASSALSLRDAQFKNSASTEVMNASTERARSSFVAAAKQMGMNESAANRLADQYGLIPVTVKTDVSAPGAVAAYQQTGNFRSMLAQLPESEQTRILSILDRSGFQAAYSELNRINGTSATTYVYTVRKTVDGSPLVGGKGGQQARAAGGPVYGPGSTTSDDIPVWLSNREFVHTAAAHDYYGSRAMWAMNLRLIPREVFSGLGFASGGSPTSPVAPALTASRVVVQNHPGRGIPLSQLDYLADRIGATVLAGARETAYARARATAAAGRLP